MMQLSNVTVRSSTCSDDGPVNVANPWITSTLRRLARPTMPPVSRSTTPVFHSISLPTSIFGCAEA